MKNQLFRIAKSEKEVIKNDMYNRGYFVVEIDSVILKNYKILMKTMAGKFKFPHVVTNFNSLNDYMTDLDWLDNKVGYTIFINKFHEISCVSYDESIRIAESSFCGMMRWLYYWEEEITKVTGYWDEESRTFSGGLSPKRFNIYLVD
ncbi:barstar family protein [Enterococcus termitis]|uniref:Barstar (barnase inhibitor) domain-containing protein n=1 Tax=Enterococcus termitis TaxID=332950 RepID=A0A1E5GCK5_9ENTE|nr:hypothetical protein [Enterococcus termitis]OEG10466.1 hypothetical protein BCR25_08280 [Enterococcus termitis]OJG97447.1 hypothetical protein RV18_GL000728 [Enterococcus termitis]